jgi:uncharacterized protein (DUF2147 family)
MPSGLLMRFSRSSLNAMLAGGAMALAVATGAVAAEPSAVGLWQKTEDGKPVVWVLVVDRNGVFEGAFAKMFPKAGDKEDMFCSKCEDDRKDKPLLGLSFIRDMKRKGGSALEYEGGNILDPRDGKIYRANMKVSPDGQTLFLRGYIGWEWAGRTEEWSRVPDKEIATLDPAVLQQYLPQLAPRAVPPKAPPANQRPKPPAAPKQ